MNTTAKNMNWITMLVLPALWRVFFFSIKFFHCPVETSPNHNILSITSKRYSFSKHKLEFLRICYWSYNFKKEAVVTEKTHYRGRWPYASVTFIACRTKTIIKSDYNCNSFNIHKRNRSTVLILVFMKYIRNPSWVRQSCLRYVR